MNKKNNRKGFTTVELVIVIAVIAILATALIPTFGGLIGSANKTADEQAVRNAYRDHIAADPENNATATYSIHCGGKYYAVNAGALSLEATNAASGSYVICLDTGDCTETHPTAPTAPTEATEAN